MSLVPVPANNFSVDNDSRIDGDFIVPMNVENTDNFWTRPSRYDTIRYNVR